MVKALVLRAAGTNCDRETTYALEQAGFSVDRVHVFRLMENPAALKDYQFLVIPGGFSYGDDVAAGKILANQMLYRLAEPLNDFVAADKLALGICNGFQVMIKAGLLPWGKVEPAGAGRDATLAWNDNGRFEDRWVHMRTDSDKCVFLPKGQIIALPIAHGEGKFVPREASVLDALRSGDQIPLRYVDEAGQSGGYPVNPNGSTDDIAGLCDPTGRIMGLMPHPERFIDPTQHPQWTRRQDVRDKGIGDGAVFFRRAAEYLS
ncbi:MAG: phosphoribosylformylglycinamidine synthase I [Planctomycetaceae bacterium]|nr:phosphoribosylformylglycinamidine synthase I [Planctomycetaceae bacterium]